MEANAEREQWATSENHQGMAAFFMFAHDAFFGCFRT